MNKNKTIQTLQEALRIFWLENAQAADSRLSERDLELILSADNATFQMSEEKKKKLIDKLYDTIEGPSLGTLVTAELAAKEITDKKFAKEADIPLNILTELKEDKAYPNSIPVLAMKDILNRLSISYQQAKLAILKTYELIKMNISLTGKAYGGQVSFRKGDEEEEAGTFRKTNRSDRGSLFENKESLMKYLDMLEKEMSE